MNILFACLWLPFLFVQQLYGGTENYPSINELINKTLSTAEKEKAEIEIVQIGKSAVPSLLKAFRKGSYAERKTIGSLIIKIGSDAVPALESSLLGSDEDLASNCAILLGEIGPISIPSLKKVLSVKEFSSKLERQREAAYSLGRIGPAAYPAMIDLIAGMNEPTQGLFLIRDALTSEGKPATPPLIKALKSSSPILRILAAIILGQIKDDASIPALIEALNDRDRAVCTQVVIALSALRAKAKEAAPFIIKRLKEIEFSEPLVISEELKYEVYVNFRKEAIYALHKIGTKPEDVLPSLIRYMQHNDSEVRSAATYVVGRYKPKNSEQVEALIQAANDIKGEVRKKAIESFGSDDVGNYGVLKVVLLKLNDPYPSVRGSAAKTLGNFLTEHENIIPLLINAMEDEDDYVRSQAAISLGEFRDNAKQAIPVLIRAIKDQSLNVKIESVKAIGKIGEGSEDVLEALQESLLLENNQIQIETANALQRIGLASVPILIEALKTGDENVQKISAKKLGNIRPKAISAIPHLINALHYKSPLVREQAAKSLGMIGPSAKAATSDLILLLNEKNVSVCRAAINALGNIGPDASDAIPKLIDILNTGDVDKQKAAIDTIGKFGANSKQAVIYLVKIIEGKDIQLIPAAINSLRRIGPAALEAVPILIAQLCHQKTYIIADAAQALGSIGANAKSALPNLIKTLYDENQEVKYRTADALADIAKDLSDKRDVRTISLLEEIANHFESNADLKTERYPDSEHYKSIIRAINHLKALRVQNIVNYSWQFVINHPIITIIVLSYAFWVVVCYLILWLNPLKLLSMNRALSHYEWQIPVWLGGGGLKIPLRYVLYFGFLNYKDQVLDKWVLKHIDIASSRFNEKGAVKLREAYIPMPVSLNNNRIQDLSQDSIRPAINSKNCCMLISGEGGVGKTSLAFQIAKWAISKNGETRFYEHPMIPVLIEYDLASHEFEEESPLLNSIIVQLQDITDSAPIPKDFAYALIRKKRILVIIDHLSEMNNHSRNAIIKELGELKINAVVVTSRIEEPLGGITKTVIKPLRIAGEGIVIFIAAYLRKMNKREMFSDNEFLEACHSFSSMIGDSPIIFAKLFSEQLIAFKQADISELPKNIPDLMLSYLNEINSNVIEGKIDNRSIHSYAKILAWESLKDSFIPSPVRIENAKKALGVSSSEDKLNYLEYRLMLIETIEPSNDRIRFLLDPLSEYLACLFVVEKLGNNEAEWRNLIDKIKEVERDTTLEINDFINALYECISLKGEMFSVPSFVPDALKTQTS